MSKKKLKTKSFTPLINKERGRKKLKPLAPELKQIENHPFYQEVIKHGLIPLWEEYRKAQKEKRELEPTKELEYHVRVAQYAVSLFEALKRLHDIPYFMEQNPNLVWLENKNIGSQEWFIYHYANYRVVATGILDTVLLIVNDVLKIDLQPQHVHRDKFLDRKEVLESGLLPQLQVLDNFVEKYRQERNKYVHRSEKPEIEFVHNLAVYRFMREAKEKGFYKGQLPTQPMAHAYFVQQRSHKAAEMRKDTAAIFVAILDILEVLYPLYLKETEQYKII